ncbi:MAG: hypothetical protein R2688_05975 [Fimbriimonadaceae bacterium]
MLHPRQNALSKIIANIQRPQPPIPPSKLRTPRFASSATAPDETQYRAWRKLCIVALLYLTEGIYRKTVVRTARKSSPSSLWGGWCTAWRFRQLPSQRTPC